MAASSMYNTSRAALTNDTSNPITMTESADKFVRFENWLRQNGAQFDMLELREYDSVESTSSLSSREQPLDNDDAEEKKEPPKECNPNDEGCDGDSEMRGVHARTTIPPNTVCVSVPRKCLITVEMGQATDIGQAILHSDLDLDAPKHIFLMIYLLWDRRVNGSKSFFKPYYDILPRTLRNMPIFWSDEELANLAGSYLLAQIADRNDAITDDYHAICDLAPELADIATLEEFKWARMCVCSRNFGLQIDGHRTSALVPHADMLNHYRPRETKWTFDDERQSFTITTLQTIPSGAQVYDSYGQKCNHRFLLNYGFAVEDNRELDGFCPNEVPIELGVLPEDPLFDLKHDFWTRGEGGGATTGIGGGVSALAAAVAAASTARMNQQSVDTSAIVAAVEAAAAAAAAAGGGTENSAATFKARSLSAGSEDGGGSALPSVKRVRVCVSNNENTRILFSMLRVLACNEIELRAIACMPSDHDGGPGCISRSLLGLSGAGGAGASSGFYRTCRDIRHPLNIRNEKAAMKHLLFVIGRALSMYPTTLAQDIDDLSDERAYPRFSNKRHAKIQVRGEKEVLHHFETWARTAIYVMDVIERELAEERGETNLQSGNDTTLRKDFDDIVRDMEEEEGLGTGQHRRGLHHTVVRYCSDVLGALRREEIKTWRRVRALKGGGAPCGLNPGYV